ncbi:hypothetical protein BDR07DRAFT_892023 [Suillus spraguei]|nr:hypothetical protein BDR07DRAFT_892023 [Suillus spraguei]
MECEHNLTTTMAYVHSPDELFQCMWVGEYGLHCNDLIFGRDTSVHLRNCHGIRGADELLVRCCWEGCTETVKKESITRHVQAVHLGIAYPCNICNKAFTRTSNLEAHKRNCRIPQ